MSLTAMKDHTHPGEPLEKMQVLKISRLSVTSVSEEEWDFINAQVDSGGSS